PRRAIAALPSAPRWACWCRTGPSIGAGHRRCFGPPGQGPGRQLFAFGLRPSLQLSVSLPSFHSLTQSALNLDIIIVESHVGRGIDDTVVVNAVSNTRLQAGRSDARRRGQGSARRRRRAGGVGGIGDAVPRPHAVVQSVARLTGRSFIE